VFVGSVASAYSIVGWSIPRDERRHIKEGVFVFQRSIAKLSIGSLDEPSLAVAAHYNPKDLQFQRSVPWTSHQLANHGAADQLDLEFTGSQPRTMDLEMLFDCVEQQNPDDPRTIEQLVDVVETLAAMRDPEGDAAHRRPHFCVTWGDRGVKRLRCVIEAVTVKYTMFDRIGTPLRAVCTLKVKEARLRDTDYEANSAEQMRAVRRRMVARMEQERP
jgi:hypothetical protein